MDDKGTTMPSAGLADATDELIRVAESLFEAEEPGSSGGAQPREVAAYRVLRGKAAGARDRQRKKTSEE
ncbi:hypothetical protein ACIHCQ_03265 [Streptomyces sp. NPDC052236]|uniref:hypothetical protein n=1 Tax=Streptomyces sp. NPDC052236 TaxID=3365686 RepID=UPI0037D66CCE